MVATKKQIAAERILQRTYYVAGRSVYGLNAGVGAETPFGDKVQELTLGVLTQRRLRYNEPTHVAVDRVMKRTHGEW